MIGIINYGAGNIFSLTAALERQKIAYGMINSREDFERFERYIIPGVGHAGAAMKKLEATGLIPLIKESKKPVLGICVGMQLLTNYSEEGDSKLTSIMPMDTRLFKSEELKLKVPHMGWNRVKTEMNGALFNGIASSTARMPSGMRMYRQKVFLRRGMVVQ